MDGTLDTVAYSVVSPSSVFARVIYVSSSITFCRTISCLSVVHCFLPFVARLLLRLSSIPRPVTMPSFICRVFVFAGHGFIFPAYHILCSPLPRRPPVRSISRGYPGRLRASVCLQGARPRAPGAARKHDQTAGGVMKVTESPF